MAQSKWERVLSGSGYDDDEEFGSFSQIKNNSNNNHNLNRIELNKSKIVKTLTEMGYNEYHILESFNYISQAIPSLEQCVEWCLLNPMSSQELKYRAIEKFTNIYPNITKPEALYIFSQSNNQNNNNNDNTFDVGRAVQWYSQQYCKKQQNNNDNNNNNSNSESDDDLQIISVNNNNNQQNIVLYSDLSNNEKEEYLMNATILESSIQTYQQQRRQSYQMDMIRDSIRGDLKELGFLTHAINLALQRENKEVVDKKTAIQWIIAHPLSEEDEIKAKLNDLEHSGFKKNDCTMALNKFQNNLHLANLWLNQQKPQKMNHYLWHIETSSLLEIQTKKNNNNNNDDQKNDNNEFVELRLADKVFRPKWSQWSYFEDGTLKNYENSLILGVICRKKRRKILYQLELIDSYAMKLRNLYDYRNNTYKDDICIVANDNAIKNGCKWDIDTQNRTIKNRMSNLYLTYSDGSLKLSAQLNYDDMSGRWALLNDMEISEMNDMKSSETSQTENSNNKIYRECLMQIENEIADRECIICFETPTKIGKLHPCKHDSFCYDCIKDYKNTSKECPICRTIIKKCVKIKKKK